MIERAINLARRFPSQFPGMPWSSITSAARRVSLGPAITNSDKANDGI